MTVYPYLLNIDFVIIDIFYVLYGSNIKQERKIRLLVDSAVETEAGNVFSLIGNLLFMIHLLNLVLLFLYRNSEGLIS